MDIVKGKISIQRTFL